MGLKAAIVRALSGGSAPERDPEEWRELVTVPLFEASLLQSDLEAHGIEVLAQDSFNLVTKALTDVAVHVRHKDLDAAQALVVARS